MDFSNSVLVPRDDFMEMQEAAFSTPPLSTKDRIATTATTVVVSAALAGAVTAAAWGWYKAMDWYDKRAIARQIEAHKRTEATKNPE
jgi:hypothetical protein